MLGASLAWATYSWLLVRPKPGSEPAAIKADWAAFLLAQVAMGLGWSVAMTVGEWACSRTVATPAATSPGAGRWPRRSFMWRWARRCWPTAAGAPT